jgi:hypothetical protein
VYSGISNDCSLNPAAKDVIFHMTFAISGRRVRSGE